MAAANGGEMKGPFGDLGGPQSAPGYQIWYQLPPFGQTHDNHILSCHHSDHKVIMALMLKISKSGFIIMHSY